MATTLTTTELEILLGMEARAQDGQIGFWQIYEWLGNLLETKGVSQADPALLWLRGATEANAGRGSMATLIRSYTDTQYQLRYGTSIPSGMLQVASDAVARNLIDDLLGRNAPAWPMGQVPNIARIAVGDARAVGDKLFGPLLTHDQLDTAFLQNSAWSGALLFSLLRSDQSGRLVSTGAADSSIDTLNDWRDVLYAAVSYARALPAANWIYWSGNAAQMVTDAAVLGTTVIGYFNSGHTTSDVWNTVISGASGGVVGDAFARIATVGPNRLLDMLMGAMQGRSMLGATTDASFASDARAFFGALSPAQLQGIGASWMPGGASAIANLAHTDVDARAALMALSVVKLQVSTDVAQTLQLYSRDSVPGGLTDTWIADRARMLQAIAATRPGQNAIGSTNTDYFDASSSQTFVQRINGTGANAPANKVAFGTAQGDTLTGTDNVVGDRLYGMAGDDTLDGGAFNDYLEGGIGSDTYRFIGSYGKDFVWDADGQGSIQIDGYAIGTAKAAGKRNVWTAKLDDGQFIGLAVYDDSSSATGKKLVITRAGSTDNTITINNFDLQAAQGEQGHLGIKLPSTPELFLTPGDNVAAAQGNPFQAWDFDPNTFTGSSTTGAAKSFTVYLNQAATAGATLVLHLGSLAGLGIKAILGDVTVDAEGAVIYSRRGANPSQLRAGRRHRSC